MVAEDILALGLGIALASWAINFWCREEARINGIVSGGIVITPPQGGG